VNFFKIGLLALVVGTLVGCQTIRDFWPSSPTSELEKRAERGDAVSQYRLGLRYTNGRGVEQDYSAATRWLIRAADQGHMDAQYLAGVNYASGRGVEVNHLRAASFFEKAAAQGHVRSYYQLGEAYANGRGVPKDLPWAARWYEKAAERGHPGAMLSFGVFRASGMGVSKDSASAWTWLELAAQQNEAQAAELRDRIARSLTTSELNRGRRQASAWRVTQNEVFADRPTVRYVQRSLNRLGFRAGPEDGVLGFSTRHAIQSLQRAARQNADGRVSPTLVDTLRFATARLPES